MLTDDELRQFDRFLDGIDRAAKHFPERFRHCSLEVLTQGTEPLFCLVRAGVPSQAKNEFLNYGKVQLRREIFSSGDLRRRLEALNNTGKIAVEQGEIGFDLRNVAPHQSFHPSRSEYHRWPGYLYQMGVTQSTYVPSEPLVGRGLPPFFDAKDAIRHWIRVPVVDNDGRYRRFLLFIPDLTARFGRMTFADGSLRVQSSEQLRSEQRALHLRAGHGRPHDLPQNQAPAKSTELQADDKPDVAACLHHQR